MSRPTPRRNEPTDALTEAVLASFAGAPTPRAREICESLVRHLHAFVAEVAPSEDEWLAGIAFLTRAGHITTDTRQEFVLLSDVLGVSMLVIGLNHPTPDGATEPTVLGPFFVAGAPELRNGADIGAGASTTAASGSGRCCRLPIRSRPTALPASCSAPAAVTRCARRTCTSGSRQRGSGR
jgi:hydroxyquinol 1,2-dioxygenase